MDQPWETEHLPSDCAKHPRWNTSSSRPLDFNIARLRKNTRALYRIAYEPTLWLLRAQLLLALGFPELAAGDAYKARLLIEAAQEERSELGENVRLHYGMCLWLGWHHRFESALGGTDPQFITADNIADEVEVGLDGLEHQAWSVLIIALQHADCIQENAQLAKEAAEKFGQDVEDDGGPWSESYKKYLHHLLEAKKEACKVHPELADDPYLTKKVMLNGAVTIRQYPWMQQAHHLRARDVDELGRFVRRRTGNRCSVKPSQITEGELGIFAARPLAKVEEIIIDHTYTAATSDPGRCLVCCKSVNKGFLKGTFCSDEHFDLAWEKFLAPNGSLYFDSSELEEAGLVKHNTRNPLGDVLLLQRFLAIAVKHVSTSKSETHPLQVPEIARLAANYQGAVTFPWNFLQAIVLPTRILQSLGVDVFADHRFDMWVIHTIWYRINNNQAGGYVDGFRGADAPAISGVYPVHSLFNHSCDPNVTYDDHATQAAQVMRAKRDIKEGEELYIAYDLGLDAEGMSVWERREALRNWMGGDCLCARCKEESEEPSAALGDLKIEDPGKN